MDKEKEGIVLHPMIEMIMNMVGGIEGVTPIVDSMMPHLEKGIKDVLIDKSKELSKMMEAGDYNSVGYSLVLMDGKGLGVLFFLYDFRKDKPYRVSEHIGDPLTLTSLADLLLKTALEQK